MAINKLIYTSLFTALTVVGSLVSIPLPMTVVPITLQITFTLISGFVLGPNYGALSQLTYLLIGAIGLPVFSNFTGGFAMLYGPTAGFLWGFCLSSYIIGHLKNRLKVFSVSAICLIMFIGLLVIYACGMLGLMLVLKCNIKSAFFMGVAPFAIIDLLKLFVAALAVKKATNLIPLGLSL